MNPCEYADFVKLLRTPTGFPTAVLGLAAKHIDYRLALFVYVLLLDLAMARDIDHTILITQRQIADTLNVSLRTAKRATHFLKKNGYVAIHTPQTLAYQPNRIQVLFPDNLTQLLLTDNAPQNTTHLGG